MTTFLSPPSLKISCHNIETLRNVLKYQFLYPNSFKSGWGWGLLTSSLGVIFNVHVGVRPTGLEFIG